MSAQPKLVPESKPARRVRIPKAAGEEVAKRYAVHAEAGKRLADLLEGILLAKGIPREDYIGFDDTTNELILS